MQCKLSFSRYYNYLVKLDFNLIRENINNAYNLDYFKSIRYEIEYEQDETNLVFIIEESNFI